MPRPKKSIDERIQQTKEEIAALEQKMKNANELLKALLKEKEEIDKQNYYDLIKEHGLSYDEVVALLEKSKKK